MKVAIDISPIEPKSQSAHKVRGVGKYITLLRDNLTKFDKINEYIFTSRPSDLSNKVDLIHYPYFDPFFITLPLRNKVPTIVTLHDVIPLVHRKNFPVGFKGNIKWQINKMLLKNINGIITDSEASKEDIVAVTDINKDKIHTVYLAVDNEFKKLETGNPDLIGGNWKLEIKNKYDLPDKFFLYVGDVTWNKNLPRLVEAVKRVNIPLVMVGKALIDKDFDITNPWNKDLSIVNEKISGSPLFIKLGFLPTSDLVRLYNMAIALLMPSLDEGFGLPVLEAMECGCPVITSKCGSLEEVGGTAVLYCNPLDIQDIADKIIYAMSNKNYCAELTAKGLDNACKFTLKRTILSTLNVYQSI